MHLDLLKHKDQIVSHEKYVADTDKEIKEEMQATIKAQVASLLLTESNAEKCETKLKEHERKLTKLTIDYSEITSRVAELAKKVEDLGAEVKEAQEEVDAIKHEASSSFKQGEEAVMEGVQ